MITQEELAWWERGLTAVAMVLPIIPGKTLRDLGKAAMGVKGSDELIDTAADATKKTIQKSTDDIAENASRNVGGAFEDTVKATFRNKIIRQNEVLRDATGKIIGEIDFETAEALVEVGSSLRGKLPQLHKLAEVAKQRGIRLDVIYGPDTPPGTLKALKESLMEKFGNRVRFIPHSFE